MTTVYGKRGGIVRVIYLITALFFLPIVLLCSHKRKSVVLCYHGISDGDREGFKSQMCWLNRFLIKGNYHKELQRYHRLPVLITFDDAFSNLVKNAIPVIEQYRIPVYIFAVPGNLGAIPGWTMPDEHPEAAEQTMDEQHLYELSQNLLVTIGSHTYSHANLPQLSAKEIDKELFQSKEQLEKFLRKPVNDLALPYGAYTEQVIRKAISCGYKKIFTLDSEFYFENQEGKIGRFLMSPDVWKIEFILTCIGGYWWLGPWRRFIRRIRSKYNYSSSQVN